jgi:hypothetical protein
MLYRHRRQPVAAPAAAKISQLFRHRASDPVRPAAPPASTPAVATPAAEPIIGPARIAALCVGAGEPGATAAFVRRQMTESEVLSRLLEIEDMRVAARFAAKSLDDLDPNFIDGLIAMGVGITATRMILQTMILVRQSPEISTALPAADRPTDHGWGDIIAKASKKE